MPIFNGDLEFFDGSGVISVTNGDLTIRTDDPSRSIIIASGAALRSDRDIASDLGTANLRWHAAHVGNLFCTSGEIAGLTMTDTANTFGVDVVFNGVNVQFINSATTTFDDSSDISIEGNVFIGGTTSFDTRSDLKPWIDASTSLGNADVRWSTIHAASGIFNTIAPPESGTHIQVNGDLRPSEDVSYSLGTSDVRWDNVFSRSGVIGFNTFDINGVNFQDQVEFEGDVDFQGISVSLTSASFSSDANSPLSFGGNTSIFGQLTLRTDIDVLLDASYQIGNTFNRWATIHAASGTFNVITPPVSGTYIQVNGGLSPALDAMYPLGGALSLDTGGEARWSDIFAASGHFNAIYPQVSGIGVGGHPGEWIELGGSLIPPANGGAGVYWLGMSKFNLLGGVAANSGIFTDVTATTMDISSLDVSTLNINNNGDFINVGAFDWDLGGAQTLVSNGDWVFDTDVVMTASTANITTANVTNLVAASGTFTNRPTAGGSGVAMQAENYFEVYAGRNVAIADPVTALDLYVTNDGAAITPGDYFFTVSEDVQLRHYSIETVHLDTNPAPWAIRLRIEGRDNDHASGIFNWGGPTTTPFTYRGSMSGTQTIPGGSRCRIRIDADGAAGHNTAFAKVWLGMTVVSGLRGVTD